jgi:ribosomal protein S18 acetylase RimI-like enzyme
MSKDVQSGGTISIRHATHDDISLLVELGIKTFYDTFADVNTKADMDLYLEKNFNVPQVSSEIKDVNNIFLIAYYDGIPAGYAKLRKGSTPSELDGENAIELERLYAAAAFIGKSVGRILMDGCIALARQQGYTTLWLGVWEHNLRAIAFYQKCGFEKFSAHPFMLGTDLQTDHMMKKNI